MAGCCCACCTGACAARPHPCGWWPLRALSPPSCLYRVPELLLMRCRVRASNAALRVAKAALCARRLKGSVSCGVRW